MKSSEISSLAKLSQAKTQYWHAYGEHIDKPGDVFRKWADYDEEQMKRIGDATQNLLHAMASAEKILLEDLNAYSLTTPLLVAAPFFVMLRSLNITIYPLVRLGPADKLAHQELYSRLLPSSLAFIILPYRPGPDDCRAAAHLRAEGKNIVLVAPDDVDALGSALWNLSDMLEYKIFRIFLQGGVDADAVYSDWQVERFREETSSIRIGSRFQPVKKAIESRREDPQLWVKHPKFDSLARAVQDNNLVLVVGESASGKSTLALDFGIKQELRGILTLYSNISALTEQQSFQIGIIFFRKLLATSQDFLLILDDLHCRPEIGKNLLSYFQLLQNTSVSKDIRILGICWPSYLSEFKEFQQVAASITIEAADVKDRLVTKFGGALSRSTQIQMLDFAENDLLILRLLLELVRKHDLAKDYTDLAEEVWKHRSRELKGDYAALTRTVLVVSSLGQYECDVSEAFLRTQAGTNKDQLKELCRSKILIRRGDRYSLPHRSFARLLANYLGKQKEHWNWFRSHRGPKNVAELIFNYIQFLDPSEVWNVLELINKTGGIHLSSQSQQDAKFIIESWKSINALLRKIYDQQTRDPTWRRTISSATFACEALSEVGKMKEALDSIKFIREIYSLDENDLVLDVSSLSTVKDFDEIRQRMRKEELVKSYVQTYSLESADQLNVNLFHENWASGLVLCAEAALQELDKNSLRRLAEAVESRAEDEEYFYPARVPWCTARVLMGLGRCGRTIENSEIVRKIAHWLMRTRDEGGALEGPFWSPGTGTWNTNIETTAMCLTALREVGISADNSVLVEATNWLYKQKKGWTEIGREVDGAIAIESYLLSNRDWREVIDQVTYLSWWADGQAVWMYATETSEKTHQQSCRVAQVAAFLIKAMWSILRNDLPSLLTALGLYQDADAEGLPVPDEKPAIGSEAQVTHRDEQREQVVLSEAISFDIKQKKDKGSSYDYDVALSFAGEDREYAETLAHTLKERGVQVFYDRYEKTTLWGKNLYDHLSNLYQNKARYCVMFLSKHYAAKLWTNHERQAAQARAFKEHEEYILPIRLDNTEVPGILSTVDYLRWPPETAETIADAIEKKLGK